MQMVNRTEHAVAGDIGSRIEEQSSRRDWANAIKTLVGNLRRRSQIRAMRDLDDHLLRDIGLVRSDLDWALAAPWYGDPGERLEMTRAERLHATRRRLCQSVQRRA